MDVAFKYEKIHDSCGEHATCAKAVVSTSKILFFDELQGQVQVNPMECEESQGLDRSPCNIEKNRGHKKNLWTTKGPDSLNTPYEVDTC